MIRFRTCVLARYNEQGYFVKNEYDAYTVITARSAFDGPVVVLFNGCDGKIPNCLPIEKGWNYTVRLYRPCPEILDGNSKFSEAQPVN
jgi:hypothetical protein